MKKTLVFTLILTMIISIATLVSASEVVAPTVSAGVTVASTAEEDKTLEVTVNFTGSEVKAGVIRIAYNKDTLEWAGTSLSGAEEFGTAGKMGIVFNQREGISAVTFTFNVIGEVGAKSPITVTGEDFVAAGDDVERVEVTFPTESSEVTVVAPAVVEPGDDEGNTGEEGQKPGDDQQQGEEKGDNGDNKGTDEGNKTDKTDKEGKPAEYPQTGINVAYVAGAVVLAVAAGYVVTKRS